MISGLVRLLLFRGAGELVPKLLLTLIPGPVIGLALLNPASWPVLARFVLDAVDSKAWWQRGFALGIASHGIGTSRAFGVHPEAGAYASLGMGLHGIAGAVLIPLVYRLPAG